MMLLVFWAMSICGMFDNRIRIESLIRVTVKNGRITRTYIKGV